jgi:hypothetical protein
MNKSPVIFITVLLLMFPGGCSVVNETGETLSPASETTYGVEAVEYRLDDGLLLQDVRIFKSICEEKYFSPRRPGEVEKGDPCFLVIGRIQNLNEGKSDIAMYAEGYDEAGEQVGWTLDAAHIVGQIGLHVDYQETAEFTLHLNFTEDLKTIHIYANAYSATPQ